MFTRTLAIIALVLSGLVAIPAQARDGYDSDHGPRFSITYSNYQNLWVPGYWVQHGHHPVWVEGYWTRERTHYSGHDRRGGYEQHRGRHHARKCG